MPPVKKTILIFTRGYLPGYKYGGSLRSVSNMVSALSNDYTFKIVAADRDLEAKDKQDNAPYPAITPDKWQDVDGADILYLSPGQRSYSRIKDIIKSTPHDILYLNSFFDFHFTILPLLSRSKTIKTILAPRGEFSSGALSIKRIKKRLYIFCARLCGLYKDIVWQASSADEEVDIKAAMARTATDIRVAQDIITLPPQQKLRPDRKAEDALRVLFLSRIAPKKNLDYALRVLAATSVPVIFTIAGPAEDTVYWKKCRQIIKRLPENIMVQLLDDIAPSSVPHVMAQHDLLFLPTKGENFGHVIAEALNAGTRVLISDQTPWQDLNLYNAGYALPLSDPDMFATTIEQEYVTTPLNHADCLRKCHAYLNAANRHDDIIAAHHILFS